MTPRTKLTLDERLSRRRHKAHLRARSDAAEAAHREVDPHEPVVVAASRPALASVAAKTHRQQRSQLHATRVGFVAGVVGVVAAIIAVIGGGTPLWRPEWNLMWVAGGVIVTSVSAWVAWPRRFGFGSRVSVGIVTAGVAVLVLFTWGAATSVVIDGRVYSNTSDTAQAWDLSIRARQDLFRMQEIDTLLSLDTAAARARYAEFDPAISELRRMSAWWAALEPDDVPAPGYVDVARAMATASHWGAEATFARQSLLTQPDVRLETAMRNAQDTMRAQWRIAGELTVGLSDLYGFDLTVSGRVVE